MTSLLTPLYALHEALGARLVDFAGYRLPMQYPTGIKEEHRHTRTAAGLFDVSHMGHIRVTGAEVAAALETLVPGEIRGLGDGRQRYTVLTNTAGGVLDDLVVTRYGDDFVLVVNAATKVADVAYLAARLAGRAAVELRHDTAMLALQGPAAATVLAAYEPALAALGFMQAAAVEIAGTACLVSRSGYTGGDGFEIALPAARAETLARALLTHDAVRPAGLAARDSLRLEAGLCLYGNELTPETTPVEAGLGWVIAGKYRGADPAPARFPGAAIVLEQLREGPQRRRVGLRLAGRAIARAGARLVDDEGLAVGTVTSGGYSPALDCPIAMAYVSRAALDRPAALGVEIRARRYAAEITPLPFVAHRYPTNNT